MLAKGRRFMMMERKKKSRISNLLPTQTHFKGINLMMGLTRSKRRVLTKVRIIIIKRS